MIIHRIQLPLNDSDYYKLNIGDKVLLSGMVYTARDAAHKKLIALVEEGSLLPIDLSNNAIFYCGPSPTPSGKVCGAIGPTTSSRMDIYTIPLLELGLKVMIGKGERSIEVYRAIQEHKAVYLSCLGGVSALLSQSIVSCETFLWPELGAEAIHRLIVKDLPAYVTIV